MEKSKDSKFGELLPFVSLIYGEGSRPDPRHHFKQILPQIRPDTRKNLIRFLDMFFRRCHVDMKVPCECSDFDLSLRINDAVKILSAGKATAQNDSVAQEIDTLVTMGKRLQKRGLEADKTGKVITLSVRLSDFRRHLSDFLRRKKKKTAVSQAKVFDTIRDRRNP